MADTIRDPFDDSEDDDIGKPPTPEIHHGGDVARVDSPDPPGFSDISDNEDKDTKEDAPSVDSEENLSRVNSPSVQEVEPRKDITNEEIDNHQGSSSPSSIRNSSPVSPISEEGSETIRHSSLSKEDESLHSELMQQDGALESKEPSMETNRTFHEQEKEKCDGENVERDDGGCTEKDDGQHAEKNDGQYDEKGVTGEPVEKDFRRSSGEITIETDEKTDVRRRRISSGGGTDDDLEIPISPLGLGLSGPESEIFDDILKSDVSKLLPDIREESAEKPAGNDEDTNQDEKEKAIPQPDQTEEDEEGSEAGEQLIADIFGASDEEEEFEGFGQEDIEVTKKKKGAREKRHHLLSNDEEEEKVSVKEAPMTVPKPKAEKAKDDSEEDDDLDEKPVFVSDFDLMIQKKKEINRTFRRKRKNIDIINDSDDLIAHMIKQMKDVVEEDRILNGAKQAATKKLKMLPSVLKHLNKADLQMTFLDLGVLSVLKDWLSPLPDGSLPHLQIREGLLKVLNEFPTMDTGSLKMSGLGKAVMYLYRHPKETRQNKEIAGKLINDWARPIFGVTSNFKSLSREEREERDYQNMSKKRRLSSVDSDGGRTPKSIDSALQSEKKAVRPGDKGFVMRARVPMPSNKDYVVRPQNNIERMDFSKKPQKMMNRFEKQKRKYDEKKKLLNRGAQRAVDISIEGRKMAL